MASNYIKKINDLPIAASQAAPGSELAQRLATLESGSFAVVPLRTTAPIVPNPAGASPAVDLSNKIIYLTKDSTVVGEDKYKEWIYTGSTTTLDNSKWEVIGTTSLDLSGYKTVQTAVSDPTASGTGITFIATISQDTNGVITPTKQTVRTGSTSQTGVLQLTDSVSSTSTTTAATPKSVKQAYDLANGKYTLPSGGIPETDLASDVQSSLAAADAAVQGILLPETLTQLSKDSDNKVTLPLVSSTPNGEAGLMSSSDKIKLDGISSGAEANVQSDWNQTTTTADDYIKNKPTLGTAASKNVAASGNASTTEVVMGNDTRLTNARTPTSHTHGNITNAGGITATGVDIANGDALVIVDASETDKLVAKTSITFDGSTTTQALTKKGTFATFYQKPSGGIPSTDLASAVQTTLGNAVQGVTVNGSSVVNSNKVAVISLADSTSTSGPGTAGVVTLEIVSI